MSKINCANCRNSIDSAAKLCPFCGSDPVTGQRLDPAPLLESEFTRREELPRGEAFLDFVRQRQGIVVSLVVLVVFLLAFGLHRFITNRNAREVADVPAIPLTEVADLSNQGSETKELPLPDVKLQFEGNPKGFQTFIVERGAVAPPQPPAAGAPAAAQPGAAPAQAGSQPPLAPASPTGLRTVQPGPSPPPQPPGVRPPG